MNPKIQYIEKLKDRTRKLGVRIFFMIKELPKTHEGRWVGNQLLRAGTSVGANYRASCRSRSPRERISKLGITIEEGDEIIYWLEIIIETNLLPEKKVIPIKSETEEILSMLVAAKKKSENSLKPE